jgi:hypothetical protein
MKRIQYSIYQRTTRLFGYVQPFCHGLGDKARIGQSSEFNPMDDIRILGADLCGHAQGEAGFAAASGPCEGK